MYVAPHPRSPHRQEGMNLWPDLPVQGSTNVSGSPPARARRFLSWISPSARSSAFSTGAKSLPR